MQDGRPGDARPCLSPVVLELIPLETSMGARPNSCLVSPQAFTSLPSPVSRHPSSRVASACRGPSHPCTAGGNRCREATPVARGGAQRIWNIGSSSGRRPPCSRPFGAQGGPRPSSHHADRSKRCDYRASSLTRAMEFSKRIEPANSPMVEGAEPIACQPVRTDPGAGAG